MHLLAEPMAFLARRSPSRDSVKRTKLGLPRLLTLLLFVNFASRVSAADKGFVIAMGGGNGTPEIYEKWRNLGGGTKAHVVLIPTANNPGDDLTPVVDGLKHLFGVQDVSVLDTKDRAKANSAEFVAPLKQATFVFIDGGRQWRLADAYLGTRVVRELRNVLERGGVIAGSSAGASILASYLVRGDPKGAEVMMAKGHEHGFGLIPNCAIDQHVSERHREHDMEPVVAAHPRLLGIGIDPNTIIVVHDGQFEVVGSGKVTITQAGQPQYSVSSGSHFDLKRRKPL
jgi:cyanophycinase